MRSRFEKSALKTAVCIALCCLPYHSGSGSPLIKSLITFEHIPSPNFGIVNCIIRDERGFLWFGTTKGLCKYDGYQVRVITVGTEQPLSGNVVGHDRQVVNAMIRMGDTALVIATDLGVWNFNLRTEQFTPFPIDRELSEKDITTLAEDPGGALWIGTSADGLFRFDRNSRNVEGYTTKKGLSDDHITCLLYDHAGNLWIGTIFGGLNVLDRSGNITAHYRESSPGMKILSSDHIMSLCEQNEDELWIGTEDGVCVLARRTNRVRQLDLHSPIKHSIWSITRDPSGRIWMAVSDLGLFSYSGGILAQFVTSRDAERSLSSVKVLYSDPVVSDGSSVFLWAGTRTGVDRVLISRNPFNNYIRDRDSLELNRGAVLSMVEDHNEILWVGLWGGGLNGYCRVNGAYRRIANFINNPANPSSLPNNNINSLVEDRHGNLWIGTNDGLAMLDSTRKHITIDKHVDEDSASLLSDDVNTIVEDHAGTIWICTGKGLSRLNPPPSKGQAHPFNNYLNDQKDARPFGGNVVSNILEDHTGTIWATTYGRGLNKFSADGSFKRFLDPADSAMNEENFIYRMVEDPENLFWLSTRAGLVLFDPRTGGFTRYPIDELNDAHIFDILPGDGGDLWLSTSIGLTRFNPRSNVFTRYGSEHGLQFNEFFSGFFRSRHGTLFAGGIDGFTEFSPADLLTSTRIPGIAITNFKVLDRDFSTVVPAAGAMILPYDQNFLSFSFAVLDYVNPLRNRFMYRMYGIDGSWVSAGNRNYATYSNLGPGDYLFEVKGCNSDNVWNLTGASISITITPPYWRTWWFRALLAVLTAGTVYAVYRYRLQRLLDLERLRLRIADDLHDDVGSNLSAIAIASRTLQRAPELGQSTRRKLAEIYSTALSTSEGMKDIVWFIKPRSDTVDDLLLRMKDATSALLSDIEHNFEASPVDNAMRVSIDFKKNFFLAFKEILTNVAKHATATRVQIRVTQQDGILEAVVNDDGRGFDPKNADALKRGNGLVSLQSRAKTIGGMCEITSRPGKGTTVRFSGRL